jgi:hypothetical protein
MAKRGFDVLRAVTASPVQLSGEPTVPAMSPEPFRDPAITLNCWGRVHGVDYRSLSARQEDDLAADVAHNVARLKAWCAQHHWLPATPPDDLKIFVSDEFKNPKSLLPAAVGQRGRIELPAWKVVAGEAPVMHELVHVYLPNGNRFLAEALAIHLQDALGSNPAFPNFGRPLDAVARDLVVKMVPEFPDGLDKIRLTDLDRIATPSALRLRVGLALYQDDPTGQAHIYSLVGSFARFLIETHGVARFRTLYDLTPLKPLDREAGAAERWRVAYGVPLGDIEAEWKANLRTAAGVR